MSTSTSTSTDNYPTPEQTTVVCQSAYIVQPAPLRGKEHRVTIDASGIPGVLLLEAGNLVRTSAGVTLGLGEQWGELYVEAAESDHLVEIIVRPGEHIVVSAIEATVGVNRAFVEVTLPLPVAPESVESGYVDEGGEIVVPDSGEAEPEAA